MKKILSIDGGGLHGILPATILKYIEEQVGPIFKQFDMIAGNSTGGIIALGLGVPLSAEEILNLYVHHGKEIFPKRYFKLPWVFSAKYKPRSLEKLLLEYFQDITLGELNNNIFVTAYNLLLRRPEKFRSWEEKLMPARDAARATSAAPTYFPPFGPYIDGGVYVNNPSITAFAEARHMWPNEDVFIMSIGTGEHTRPIEPKEAKHWGLVGWAPKLISIVMDGQSKEINSVLGKLPTAVTLRIQTSLVEGSDDMDDATDRNIQNLLKDAHRMLNENLSMIDRFCKGELP